MKGGKKNRERRGGLPGSLNLNVILYGVGSDVASGDWVRRLYG